MGYFERVMKVITMSDIVLEILDGRFPQETRNEEIEKIIRLKRKQLILVINKSDLIPKARAQKLKYKLSKEFPCIFVSTRERQGSSRLRNAIGRFCKKERNRIAIIGYPNTGKSSILNMLAGRKAALTSIKAGFTHGEQLVKVSEKIYLFDSPGIIPYKEDDEFKLVLVCAKNSDQIKDPETAVLQLIQFLQTEDSKSLEKFYSIETKGKNPEQILEQLAISKNRLMKGGLPDTENMAKIILMDWQKGRLKL